MAKIKQPLKEPKKETHTPCTIQQFNTICDIIKISSDSIQNICKEAGTTKTRFYLRVNTNEDNRDLYARAKVTQCSALFEKLDDIANEPLPTTASGSLDSAAVQDKRVRIDTLKWKLSKMLPKKYGDKIDVSTNGESLNKPPVFILPSQKDIDNIQGVIERMDKDASLSCD